MFIYLVIASGALALAFNTRLSAMAQALAPPARCDVHRAVDRRAVGPPTWGTYWAWTRMTSGLILLFLYFGIMALRSTIDDPRRANLDAHADDRRRREHPDHRPGNGGTRCTRPVA